MAGDGRARLRLLASHPAHTDDGRHGVTIQAMTPLVGHLLSLQTTDGGFGVRAGIPSTTEPTALALLALEDEHDAVAVTAARRARAWLEGAQTADGGWPAVATIAEPSWATALAVLALGRDETTREPALAGARWLLGQAGAAPPRSQSFRDWLLGREAIVVMDDTLTGWPWAHGTFSWVEPTAYAVLALDQLRALLPQELVTRRLDVARRMLVDRRCANGGWNYGNSRVLGEDLWPYPDTTALALLALRRGPGDPAQQATSLDALVRMLAENGSGLATALGILALDAYGRDVAALRVRLRERFVHTGFRGETRALAYAALALGTGARTLLESPRA